MELFSKMPGFPARRECATVVGDPALTAGLLLVATIHTLARTAAREVADNATQQVLVMFVPPGLPKISAARRFVCLIDPQRGRERLSLGVLCGPPLRPE